jgi:two-component system, OmpR family, copper resistance phosphate regulon response regulator CusR
MKILIIEDEVKVATFLKSGLEELGYNVDVAYDGANGEKLFHQKIYEVLILDIIIPNINGIELCRKIKAFKPQVPILILTALGTTDDKVAGFDAGADDYLVKPFAFEELVARLKALAKRNSKNNSDTPAANTLKAGDLTLDLDRKVAIRSNKSISLTAKEFALLNYLISNKGKVVSRAEIAEKVWDSSFATGTNVVEVYVNILRKKIDKDFEKKLIQTRIGLGYMLEDL